MEMLTNHDLYYFRGYQKRIGIDGETSKGIRKREQKNARYKTEAW